MGLRGSTGPCQHNCQRHTGFRTKENPRPKDELKMNKKNKMNKLSLIHCPWLLEPSTILIEVQFKAVQTFAKYANPFQPIYHSALTGSPCTDLWMISFELLKLLLERTFKSSASPREKSLVHYILANKVHYGVLLWSPWGRTGAKCKLSLHQQHPPSKNSNSTVEHKNHSPYDVQP